MPYRGDESGQRHASGSAKENQTTSSPIVLDGRLVCTDSNTRRLMSAEFYERDKSPSQSKEGWKGRVDRHRDAHLWVFEKRRIVAQLQRNHASASLKT
jgi:hypothetical protein